jgi:methyl-accepting chemotaxis protein/methyl-accepting chemotaxis protein-2 (aspartate sensor receptor)
VIKNLGIKKKLIIGLSIIGLLVLLSNVFTFTKVSSFIDLTTKSSSEFKVLKDIEAVSKLNLKITEIAMYSIIDKDDEDISDTKLKKLETLYQAYTSVKNRVIVRLNEEQKSLLVGADAKLQKQKANITNELRNALKSSAKMDEDDFDDLLFELDDKINNLATSISKDFEKIVHIGTESVASIEEQQHAYANSIIQVLLISSIILTIAIITILVLSSQDIIKSIQNIININQESLDKTKVSVLSLTDATHELSNLATRQAANIQQITASLEESTATININSENAQRSSDLNQKANDSARQGYKDIEDLSSAMNGIVDSSNQIANIIKTIDEIAFQTNLLALNAAVEAARAGEHGLGFAVVAEEVRALASRSSAAASEISTIIEGSLEQVTTTQNLTKQTHHSFDDILEKIRQTSSLATEIASASKEQSENINQIAKAISSIDSMTQELSSTSLQTASSANDLKSQTEQSHTVIVQASQILGE